MKKESKTEFDKLNLLMQWRFLTLKRELCGFLMLFLGLFGIYIFNIKFSIISTIIFLVSGFTIVLVYFRNEQFVKQVERELQNYD